VVDSGLRLELNGTCSTASQSPKSSCSTQRKPAAQAALIDRNTPLVGEVRSSGRTTAQNHARGPPHRDYGLLRRIHDLKPSQMLAGHADLGTTANIYAQLDTSDLETALKALNEESA
jgi:hypothetical protein